MANPYASSVTHKGEYVMRAALVPGQHDTAPGVTLGESVELIHPNSNRGMQDPSLLNFHVEIERVFPVHPSHLGRGCHSRFSLEKSIYIGEVVGGDPRCGGGMKYFTPTRLRKWIEGVRLGKMLAQKTVAAFTYYTEDGSNGVYWAKLHSGEASSGNLHFLVGDEQMVRQCAKERQWNIKPVQLVFA